MTIFIGPIQPIRPMTKFFRTFHQRLLSINKVGNHLLHAVGEFIPVFIGQRFALQVKDWKVTWNIERAERMHIAKMMELLTQPTYLSIVSNMTKRRLSDE